VQQKKLAINLDTQLRSGELVLKLDKLVVGYGATNDQRPTTNDIRDKETRRQGDKETTDDRRLTIDDRPRRQRATKGTASE
jgi:hypothetical protein